MVLDCDDRECWDGSVMLVRLLLWRMGGELEPLALEPGELGAKGSLKGSIGVRVNWLIRDWNEVR